MSTPSSTLLEFRNLSFAYQDDVVLHDVSLAIPRGKVTALIGPAGAGKTTTLRLMGGQLRASQGAVLFDGQDLTPMNQKQLFAARRRMGMLFQFGALFVDMTVDFSKRTEMKIEKQILRLSLLVMTAWYFVRFVFK